MYTTASQNELPIMLAPSHTCIITRKAWIASNHKSLPRKNLRSKPAR